MTAGAPMHAQVPEEVLAVCRRLHDKGHQAPLVGGGVRDMLLLSSSNTVLPGSAGYGLRILGRVPLE